MIPLARKIAARLLYEAWTRLAVLDVHVDGMEVTQSQPRTAEESYERLLAIHQGRAIEVWLPLSLERRLRAALHRMNGNVLCAGWGEDELFDVDGDLDVVFVSAATRGVESFEEEDECVYDDLGLPVEGDLMREDG